jgi:hypothetical protein
VYMVSSVRGGICCIITYPWVFIYELFSTMFRCWRLLRSRARASPFFSARSRGGIDERAMSMNSTRASLVRTNLGSQRRLGGMRLYFRPVCLRIGLDLCLTKMALRVLMGSSLGSVFRIDRHHHHFDQKSTNRTENKQITQSEVAPAQPPPPRPPNLAINIVVFILFAMVDKLLGTHIAYLLIPDD